MTSVVPVNRGPQRAATLRLTTRLAWNLAMVAMTAAATAWVLGIGFGPLRHRVAALLALTVLVSLLLGRVADNWPARLLRTTGYALVGAEGFFLTHSFAAAGSVDQVLQKTTHGVPLFGTVLTLCTLAIAAATARRSAIDARALAIGGGVGAVVGLVFLAPALILTPLPASPGWALVGTVTAGCAACVAMLRWVGPTRAALIGILCALLVTTLLLVSSVEGMLQFLPHSVPDTSPSNVSAADRLENNRLGAEDPYLLLLGLGGLVAAALAWLGVTAWWRRGGPVAGPGQIGEVFAPHSTTQSRSPGAGV